MSKAMMSGAIKTGSIMTRSFAGLVGLIVLAGMGGAALAQQPGDAVRKIVLLTDTQGASPQAFQASQLIAQSWRQLGLEVEIKPLPRQQQTQVVWYERNRWDVTTWRMIGRPERSDPDELVYNLFHSSTVEKGYNFVGYVNPEYDRVAEAQRQSMDQTQRKVLIAEAQQIINRDQPYAFLVHPASVRAYSKAVWDERSIVSESGVGIRNFWTFIGATPVGRQKQMVLNASLAVIAIHPLFISGATDSWITELIWDRLARVGPDGMPRPWAAESFSWVDDKTLDVSIRDGMTWHDGRPVTVDDVVFSFEAPGTGDKAPMYRPFVTDIAKVERTGERMLRFNLKKPNASFVTSSLAKINLIPRHIWEPVLRDLAAKPETVEAIRDPSPVGSGPFRLVRARPNEEIVLDRYDRHWAAPKMERWILRIVTNPEATIGMLRSGELNFLGDYSGDPEVLDKLSRENPDIATAAEVDIGFEHVAFNNRRPPFNDAAFRRALSFAIDRKILVQSAWNDFAVTANSPVSPALKSWHDASVDDPKTGVPLARDILEKAGYRVAGGRLHYPAGGRETLKPGE
jgi:peptide/nickel transport system substrate-binding protein